ncbi:unnamed protein product, partial [Laminaria digitata]
HTIPLPLSVPLRPPLNATHNTRHGRWLTSYFESMQLVLLASVGLLWASTEAVTNLSIGTCAELQDAAGATSSDEVVGELVNGGVSCDTWTTFEIAANRLKLIAPEGSSSDDVFVFNNVRLLVASDATLRVLPMVEFTGGDESQ